MPRFNKGNAKYLHYLLPLIFLILGYVAVIATTGERDPFTIVTGTSMEPTIMPGSIAIIRDVPFNTLMVGEVIVFMPQVAESTPCDTGPPSASPVSEAATPCYVIHRIISIRTLANGSMIVTTKGDNNPTSYVGIDTNITQSMYVGMVILQFPIIGDLSFAPYNQYTALLLFTFLVAQIAFDARMRMLFKKILRNRTRRLK